jgi:hypothetical protein
MVCSCSVCHRSTLVWSPLGLRLGDPAVGHHDDAIGAHRRRQPVGDEDGRPALQQQVEGGLDPGLRCQVQVGCGLVEDEHAGLDNEGTR